MATPLISSSWQAVLAAEFAKPYFQQLQDFISTERQAQTIFPTAADVFAAFELTPYEPEFDEASLIIKSIT
ncbi:hypothetical protein [Chamaesiphon sp.]|uniref:hypothetical protein n=1 Tax=Chamaesiphon sp. TaxID=2814140 RepID=UPI0035933E9A